MNARRTPPTIVSVTAVHNVKRNVPELYVLGTNGRLYQLNWKKDDREEFWQPWWSLLPALPLED